MSQYANVNQVPLSIGVFLASDYYDYNPAPNTISVTTLMKPLRQIILSSRLSNEGEGAKDLIAMLPSRMGAAIHDAVERAWTTNHQAAMSALGFNKFVIDKVVVNPPAGTNLEGKIPVYLEIRSEKKVGKWIISGKFDFVGDGRVEDVKTTSVWSAIMGSKDDDYILQGSLYRWLRPDIITQDTMAIQWIFTDWSGAQARQDPKYPQCRHQERLFILKPIAEVEQFVRRKLALIEQYWDSPEEDIPFCTDEDLWRSEPKFKYYKDPNKTLRSTKNFDDMHSARMRFIEDGAVGMIKEVPGQVKACKYCPGFVLCSQKDQLIQAGELVIE